MSEKPLSKQCITPSRIGIRERTIIPPECGWEAQEHYLVDVAFNTSNVIHRKIFYTGFIHEKSGMPNGYNEFLGCEDHLTIQDAYYMKIIAKIDLWPDITDEGI